LVLLFGRYFRSAFSFAAALQKEAQQRRGRTIAHFFGPSNALPPISLA
jgi:hypothetical protein